MKKTAILLLTHFLNEDILLKFNSMKEMVDGKSDIFLVVQTDELMDGLEIPEEELLTYSLSDLAALGYPAIAESVVPGSVHFVMMRFFLDHPDYRHYWSVEYDVEYDGDWGSFFNESEKWDADLIACDIQDFDENPHWYWWHSIVLQERPVAVLRRTRSFNPIYRLSQRALELIRRRQDAGDGGHFEVFLPTLLKAYGMTLGDINRQGRYTLRGLDKDYYSKTLILPHGTMRHAPGIDRNILDGTSGYLYHPVKNFAKGRKLGMSDSF